MQPEVCGLSEELRQQLVRLTKENERLKAANAGLVETLQDVEASKSELEQELQYLLSQPVAILSAAHVPAATASNSLASSAASCTGGSLDQDSKLAQLMLQSMAPIGDVYKPLSWKAGQHTLAKPAVTSLPATNTLSISPPVPLPLPPVCALSADSSTTCTDNSSMSFGRAALSAAWGMCGLHSEEAAPNNDRLAALPEDCHFLEQTAETQSAASFCFAGHHAEVAVEKQIQALDLNTSCSGMVPFTAVETDITCCLSSPRAHVPHDCGSAPRQQQTFLVEHRQGLDATPQDKQQLEHLDSQSAQSQAGCLRPAHSQTLAAQASQGFKVISGFESSSYVQNAVTGPPKSPTKAQNADGALASAAAPAFTCLVRTHSFTSAPPSTAASPSSSTPFQLSFSPTGNSTSLLPADSPTRLQAASQPSPKPARKSGGLSAAFKVQQPAAPQPHSISMPALEISEQAHPARSSPNVLLLGTPPGQKLVVPPHVAADMPTPSPCTPPASQKTSKPDVASSPHSSVTPLPAQPFTPNFSPSPVVKAPTCNSPAASATTSPTRSPVPTLRISTSMVKIPSVQTLPTIIEVNSAPETPTATRVQTAPTAAGIGAGSQPSILAFLPNTNPGQTPLLPSTSVLALAAGVASSDIQVPQNSSVVENQNHGLSDFRTQWWTAGGSFVDDFSYRALFQERPSRSCSIFSDFWRIFSF